MSAAMRKRPPAETSLPLDAITLDPELQPRAQIDRDLLGEYADAIVGGAQFPPVVVYRVPGALLLADGFHRWDAHRLVGRSSIDAEVRSGTREDAIRHSLQANARHGARRKRGDYAKGYETALRLGLIDEDRTAADVATLLECSADRAEQLHGPTREAGRRRRDAEVAAKLAEGKTQAQVAAETGMTQGAVSKTAARYSKSDERIGNNPVEDAADNPKLTSEARALLEEIHSPANMRWFLVLDVLRTIHTTVGDLDALFAHRITAFDHAIPQELDQAIADLSAFARRYRDV